MTDPHTSFLLSLDRLPNSDDPDGDEQEALQIYELLKHIEEAIEAMHPSLDEMFLLLRLLPLYDVDTFDMEEMLITKLYELKLHEDARLYDYMPSSTGLLSLIEESIYIDLPYTNTRHRDDIALFRHYMMNKQFAMLMNCFRRIDHPTPQEARYILCMIMFKVKKIPEVYDLEITQLLRRYESIFTALGITEDTLYYEDAFEGKFRPEPTPQPVRRSKFKTLMSCMRKEL